MAGKLLHFHTVWLTYFTGNINKKLRNAQYVRIIVFTTVYPSTWFSIFSVFFRVLVRAVSYTIHGLIPASCVFADRYNREEVVASLGREINLNPPLTLGQLPDTSEELLKLDQVKDTQCGNCRIFWYLRFYVQSILMSNCEMWKLQHFQFTSQNLREIDF